MSDTKIVKKEFKNLPKPDIIRLGNNFVDEFFFEEGEITNIPIDALRTIFNIVANLRNEQFLTNQCKQLSLFEEEFETEHNSYAAMKIQNKMISPGGNSKHVIGAIEYLVKFKMSWYTSENSKGQKIKTYGGLITSPSYNERGYTSFLISSYWLRKLIVIPEYNPTLFNLVYNIKNNKHVLFAVWLEKIPEEGTTVSLEIFNKKFGVNYATTKSFCNDFLKPIRKNLDKFNKTSFNYSVSNKDKIHIFPYPTKDVQDITLSLRTKDAILIRQRLRYYKRRHELTDEIMKNLTQIYKNSEINRNLIEDSYKIFVKENRKTGKKSTEIKGEYFLLSLQEIIVKMYQMTKTGKQFPNGYFKITNK